MGSVHDPYSDTFITYKAGRLFWYYQEYSNDYEWQLF
jgi:hypothetical protein